MTGADVDDASVVEARFLSDGATYASVRLGETWHLNAQTPQAWAGTVQTFRVVLSSGSVHEAVFRFR